MNKLFSAHGISFIFGTDMQSRIESIRVNHNFSIEAGGILVGILNPAKALIAVTDLTTPHKSDKQTRYSFIRAADGHQNEMDMLWEQSGFCKTYIGEWHTHDQKIPSPSTTDISNWIRISKRKNNADSLIFLIIGRDNVAAWTIVSGTATKLTDGGNAQ